MVAITDLRKSFTQVYNQVHIVRWISRIIAWPLEDFPNLFSVIRCSTTIFYYKYSYAVGLVDFLATYSIVYFLKGKCHEQDFIRIDRFERIYPPLKVMELLKMRKFNLNLEENLDRYAYQLCEYFDIDEQIFRNIWLIHPSITKKRIKLFYELLSIREKVNVYISSFF